MPVVEVPGAARTFALSETLQSDELAPIFADAWTASRVWDASTFLSEHLVAFARAQRQPFGSLEPLEPLGLNSSSRSAAAPAIIELGSGCGLAGIVAASLGADVVLTDQREAVELLRRNAEANATSVDERRRLRVCEFVWGSDPATTLPRTTFDCILVSDCTLRDVVTQVRKTWFHISLSLTTTTDTYAMMCRHQSDLRPRVLAQPRAQHPRTQ